MDKMIAYCGLVCTDCPAYTATQENDQAALERVAAQWREEYNASDITVESVICDGWRGAGRRQLCPLLRLCLRETGELLRLRA